MHITSELLLSLVQETIYEHLTEGSPHYDKRKPMSTKDLASIGKLVLEMQLRDDELQREARKTSADTITPFPATP